MKIIKERSIIEDTWLFIAPDSDETRLPEGKLILPLRLWEACRHKPTCQNRALGVALSSNEVIDDIVESLGTLDVIALEFPSFKDGRHYSSARLLRDRYNYQGEIRAYGDVNRDQLAFMARVGFDAFQLQPGADLESALSAFEDFSVSYQGSHDQPLPLYRRRTAK